MKYQDRRFTVRVGDNETYRNNWEQIKWPSREKEEKKEDVEEAQEEKKD